MQNSIQSLIDFLTTAANSDQLKFHTARTRKTAIRILLNILTPQEKSDILKIDFSTLEKRFREYEKKNNVSEPIKSSSLQTYITRLSSSIIDYNKWRISPATFQPTHTKRSKQKLKPLKIKSIDKLDNEIVAPISSPIYIALRESSLIEIKNLPNDLNTEEVKIICEAIKQYTERKDL